MQFFGARQVAKRRCYAAVLQVAEKIAPCNSAFIAEGIFSVSVSFCSYVPWKRYLGPRKIQNACLFLRQMNVLYQYPGKQSPVRENNEKL